VADTLRLTKPARRSPKPRKPIARGTAKLKRSAPPKRSRLATKSGVNSFRRKARIKPTKRPRRKLLKYADSLWSAIVRRREGGCVSGRDSHAGVFQAAHGFSRRYHATRLNLLNGHKLCLGCHVFFTHRPLEWDEWLRRHHGVLYEPMRLEALANEKQDLALTVTALEAVLHGGAGDPLGR
jgi:hypothetical protein